jgi:hypothetical protein
MVVKHGLAHRAWGDAAHVEVQKRRYAAPSANRHTGIPNLRALSATGGRRFERLIAALEGRGLGVPGPDGLRLK